MPEMPEVEIIRRSLDKYLAGLAIMKVEVLLARQIKWPTPEGFCALAEGQTVCGMGRVGKYLLLLLADGSELVFHLRMTGRLVYVADGRSLGRCARLVFRLSNGAALVYGDTRTLGVVYGLRPGERHIVRLLSKMGPEPLSAGFTVGYLTGILAKRRTKLKPFLLNQQLIGGIGNIYADEALFAAGLHPERLANSLTPDEARRLHAAINQAIADGLADGGTTFRDYRNADGKQGGHQDNLRVYNRAGQPCHACGQPIAKITVAGRGTHFCPHCQPQP